MSKDLIDAAQHRALAETERQSQRNIAVGDVGRRYASEDRIRTHVRNAEAADKRHGDATGQRVDYPPSGRPIFSPKRYSWD